MAAGNLCVCVLLALVAGNLIMAEEEKSGFMGMNPFDFFSSFLGDSRQKRSPSPDDQAVATNSSNENQARFFLPYFVGCNYTNANETGATCRDCRTALRCYPNNVGLVRTCRGFLPYCNNGRCSFTPGSACNSTSG